LASNFAIFEESWVLLHAPKLEHGTDYFTFPPKEGMLWILPVGKIRRLRSGANPRSWVPEASMLTTITPKPLVMYVIVPYNKVLFYVLYFFTSQSEVDFGIVYVFIAMPRKVEIVKLIYDEYIYNSLGNIAQSLAS
jgi:hypothetical protein